MIHKHFETIPSTQIYLKENIDELLNSNNNVLITAETQTNGIGRSGNSWLHNPNSLAMSFTLAPNDNLLISTIEIGNIISNFFREFYGKNIYLKWPNDLMNSDSTKLGGIITHFYNNKTLMIGVGINLGAIELNFNEFRNGISSIILEEQIDRQKLAIDLYLFLQKNRLNESEIINSFDRYCIHQNKQVEIIAANEKISGIFIGIDKNGFAMIESQGTILTINSGSLNIL